MMPSKAERNRPNSSLKTKYNQESQLEHIRLRTIYSVIQIHVNASEFYLNAYQRNPSKESLDKFIQKQKHLNKLILEIVNG